MSPQHEAATRTKLIQFSDAAYLRAESELMLSPQQIYIYIVVTRCFHFIFIIIKIDVAFYILCTQVLCYNINDLFYAAYGNIMYELAILL